MIYTFIRPINLYLDGFLLSFTGITKIKTTLNDGERDLRNKTSVHFWFHSSNLVYSPTNAPPALISLTPTTRLTLSFEGHLAEKHKKNFSYFVTPQIKCRIHICMVPPCSSRAPGYSSRFCVAFWKRGVLSQRAACLATLTI